MIKWLCSSIFDIHKTCEVNFRNNEISLLAQIQELKAIHDYQTAILEKKISELEDLLKDNSKQKEKAC